jgi:hypothetical protein
MFVPYPCLRLIHGFVFMKIYKTGHEQLWQGLPARPRFSDLPSHFLTHSWPVARVFVAIWLYIIGLVLFESLML